ncbi:4-coumarate--CoA ligase 5-like [Homarus americanus]|uniref:4-coumarate--CoA ligase 5-like n=1 Tax=Homarus americanus TaxID=6706 RepID=UPI001C483524|nr:4-coumarate--CoA ligase 5-like [Homarus americanus]
MLSFARSSRAMKPAHLFNSWKSCALTLTAGTHAHTLPRREKNVVYSDIPDIPTPHIDLPGLIFSRAKNWMNHDAIECGITGRKYTYAGMIDRALRWGGVVQQVLSAPSSSKLITLFCSNAPEFPILLLGSQAVGVTITTISSASTVEELARQLEDSGTEVVVTDPQFEEVLMSALARLNKVMTIFVNGDSAHGHPNLRHIIEDDSKPLVEPVENPLTSTSLLLYSSGTTGKPKGVELSHSAIVSNLVNFSHPDLLAYRCATAKEQEVVVGVMPFYHTYGIYVVGLISWYLGAKIVTLPAFTPHDFVRVVKDHKVRILHLVPPILNFMVMSPTVTPTDLVNVEVAMCAGAPVPVTAAEALKKKAPKPILFQEGFGMTEALATHMTPVNEEKIGSCGKCLPNAMAKVADLSTGKALPAGERGELRIKSPSLMKGYHKNPTAFAESFDDDGWFCTGDVATQENGFFYIVDRIKELIKVKGYQVSPSELEDLLLQHSGVKNVAVVGVPDERAGEMPRAYVIRQDDTTEEDLNKFLEPRVAAYKYLKGGIKFVDELPTNATGKVLKRQLKELAAKDL